MMDGNFRVDRDALSEQVARQIESMIIRNEYQEGEKLPSEQTLATGFGVSRAVLREALAILKDRGLIRQKQGSGCFVASPKTIHTRMIQSVNRVAHLKQIDSQNVFEARVCLETSIVRIAAEKAAAPDIAALRELNRSMRKLEKTNGTDYPARIRIDMDFHLKIAEIAGNDLLYIFLDALCGLVTPMCIAVVSLGSEDVSGARYHDDIIGRLEAHDPVGAEEAMRQHLTTFMSNWERARENGLVPDEDPLRQAPLYGLSRGESCA